MFEAIARIAPTGFSSANRFVRIAWIRVLSRISKPTVRTRWVSDRGYGAVVGVASWLGLPHGRAAGAATNLRFRTLGKCTHTLTLTLAFL